jgi:lysozyme family protein
MESSGSFSCHLHEGSSLKWRTKYVPKGRPLTGKPPFTWEYSAADAMVYDAMGAVEWVKLGPALSACEGYNGWGYKKYHPSTPTPYLWAGTAVERVGRYVADSKWSSTTRSQQIGIAALWKEMERRKMIKIPPP